VTVIAVSTSLIFVGILAGLAPAIRAARVPPAEALRAS
jgi:ABC-type lipoprotein release transport system permease subunit